MTDAFQDHFSSIAADYAQFRPRYPPALFACVASRCESREVAWDCATGNGQAAVGLAEHFAHVIATDASDAQIACATRHPLVEYRVAPAEASGLASDSIDLVTVAQAMHWLDAPRFFDEAHRVLHQNGVVAIWAYERLVTTQVSVQAVLAHFYDHVVGSYWPPQRALAEEGYRSLTMPFVEEPVPAFEMRAAFTVAGLAGYAGTWSGTRQYRKVVGSDPVPALRAALQRAWPSSTEAVEVTWPFTLRVGRNP